MQLEIRCRGDDSPFDDRSQSVDRTGRVMPHAVPVVAVAQEFLFAHGVPSGTESVIAPELLPLPDVPLIAEELLLQARRLAFSGAPGAALEAILDQVAALREGCP